MWKIHFECRVLLAAGPGLITGWNLATATAPEARTRMKRVSLVLLLMRCTNIQCVLTHTHTQPTGAQLPVIWNGSRR